MTFDKREFRNAMGLFATGVTVVTSGNDPNFHGMTANAFSSVSLVPPLILVCVDKNTHMLGVLKESGAFTVNFLSAEQLDISNYFASSDREKGEAEFSDINYTIGETGTPHIQGAICIVDCVVHDVADAGDHDIYIGEVKAITSTPEDNPLIYFGGGYRELSAKK